MESETFSRSSRTAINSTTQPSTTELDIAPSTEIAPKTESLQTCQQFLSTCSNYQGFHISHEKPLSEYCVPGDWVQTDKCTYGEQTMNIYKCENTSKYE
jgi:hypothetical protein